MTVRLATPADAEALAEVAAVTFPLACPPDMPREDVDAFIAAELSAERFAAHLADPARILLVDAEPDGRLGGYTMVVLGEPYAADVAQCIRVRPSSELSKIYVRADRQGSGAARALLDRTLEETARRGRHLARHERRQRAGAAVLREGRLRARRHAAVPGRRAARARRRDGARAALGRRRERAQQRRTRMAP
jgi:GNAT superfamily N-acetyltransferase